MQIIHVYDPSGKELLSRDLSGETKPLLVTLADGAPELVEAVGPGVEVLGALVPNEDGWSLAASSLSKPVTAGPKTAPDIQLSAGMVCMLGGLSFRLECDRGGTGAMLLWRYAGSKVVADQVAAGRNLVAVNAADSTPAVNPALAGDVLFEFFPSVNGIDVLSGSGEKRVRLQVDAGSLFAVGDFEGMYLSGADAEKAMKTSSPFGWPSRKPRYRLFAGVYLLVALLVGAAWISTQVKGLQRKVDEPRGAVETAAQWKYGGFDDADSRELLFEIKFYQSLSTMLGRTPSLVAADLIRTGLLPEFSNNVDVARCVRFLRDVTEIQTLIKAGRWERLAAVLGQVDRPMFTRADADGFYDDASRLSSFVNDTTPKFISSMLAGTYDEKRDLPVWEKTYAAVTNDNVFYASPGVQNWIVYSGERIRTVTAYCNARGLLAAANAETDVDKIAHIRETFSAMDDHLRGDVFSPAVSNEVVKIRRMVKGFGETVVRSAGADSDGGRIGLLLGEVAELGDAVGLDEAVVAGWRKTAQNSIRRIDVRLRSLYQEYRIKSLSDLARGKEILSEMIRLSSSGNRFGAWARHELQRLAEKENEKANPEVEK